MSLQLILQEADMDKQHLEVSVVVPLFNEQDNVRSLYEQITATLAGKHNYEIVFIDDGSTDGSFERLRQLFDADKKVRVIPLSEELRADSRVECGICLCEGRYSSCC